MKRKRKITLKRIEEAIQSGDSIGFCVACGAEVYNVEPDATEYPCEACGARKVYRAEEILLMTL